MMQVDPKKLVWQICIISSAPGKMILIVTPALSIYSKRKSRIKATVSEPNDRFVSVNVLTFGYAAEINISHVLVVYDDNDKCLIYDSKYICL